jgi:signal transduction histidine kinase
MMDNGERKQKFSFLFNNMAIVFYHLNNEDSFVHYVKQGIYYSREGDNLTNLANSFFLYGGICAEFGRNKEAEGAFKQALEVRQKIGDIYYILQDMSQLASFYAGLPDPQKGIALCRKGLSLAINNGSSFTNLLELNKALAKNYKAAGDFKNYSNTLETVISLKDSSYEVNSAEELAALQNKYEVQKKENTIMQQNLTLSEQRLAIDRKNYLINRKNYLLFGSLLLFFLICVIAFLLFNGYRRKQKMKMLQMREEEKRLSAEAIREAEESERKRIAADLHDNLGAYAASIVSNLEFIKTTSEDMQTKLAMDELRNNSQSMVSQLGDTIWALKKDALALTAISDRVKVFIQRIQPSYPNIHIYVTEKIFIDPVLSPSHAFHLFQVVQEAVINAVRHSGCRMIHIDIESGEGWKITVYDDGQGMMQKSASLSSGGNGLQNMKERASITGWQIRWLANKPAGTRVEIEAVSIGKAVPHAQ